MILAASVGVTKPPLAGDENASALELGNAVDSVHSVLGTSSSEARLSPEMHSAGEWAPFGMASSLSHGGVPTPELEAWENAGVNGTASSAWSSSGRSGLTEPGLDTTDSGESSATATSISTLATFSQANAVR